MKTSEKSVKYKREMFAFGQQVRPLWVQTGADIRPKQDTGQSRTTSMPTQATPHSLPPPSRPNSQSQGMAPRTSVAPADPLGQHQRRTVLECPAEVRRHLRARPTPHGDQQPDWNWGWGLQIPAPPPPGELSPHQSTPAATFQHGTSVWPKGRLPGREGDNFLGGAKTYVGDPGHLKSDGQTAECTIKPPSDHPPGALWDPVWQSAPRGVINRGISR